MVSTISSKRKFNQQLDRLESNPNRQKYNTTLQNRIAIQPLHNFLWQNSMFYSNFRHHSSTMLCSSCNLNLIYTNLTHFQLDFSFRYPNQTNPVNTIIHRNIITSETYKRRNEQTYRTGSLTPCALLNLNCTDYYISLSSSLIISDILPFPNYLTKNQSPQSFEAHRIILFADC